MSIFPRRFYNWKVETQTIQLCKKYIRAKIVDKKLDDFINNLKCAVKIKVALRFISRNKDEKFRYFLPTRKQYPVGLIETRVHQGGLDTAKGSCKQLKTRSRVAESIKKKRRFHKLTNLNVFGA